MSRRLASLTPRDKAQHFKINPNGRVVLFGEVLADAFPERAVLGGAPFNVARHLKAFGRNPVLLSRVGGDELGRDVLDAMARNGMDVSGMQSDRRHPTGQVKVHLEHGGHRFEILPGQAYDFIHPAVARMARLPLRPALVYFGTLAQRHDVSRSALSTLLRSTDAAKFLDVNLRAPWYDENVLRSSLHHAHVVKLNAEELDELSGMFGLAEGDAHERARELMRSFDLEQMVVTCGAAGAWHIGRNGNVTGADATGINAAVVDAVGAGDGFSAVYMLGLLRRWPTEMALARANAFAAAICGIRGAIPDGAEFYKPFIQEWRA